MKRVIWILAAVLVGAGSNAHAAQSLRFDVPATGGIYEVPVNPKYVTVFYFPSPVRKAYAYNQADFTLIKSDSSLTIHPREGATGVGNISIECEGFRVGVILRIVSSVDQAAINVDFRALDVEQAFKQRVEEEVRRRLTPLQRALIQKERELEQNSISKARILVADGMRRRFRTTYPRAISRSDHQVIVRVRRLTWLGDDCYLDVEIQNRSIWPYRLADVEVVYNKEVISDRTSFAGSGNPAEMPTVPPRSSVKGVVSIPKGHWWNGYLVTVKVKSADDPQLSVSVLLWLHE